MKLLLIEIFELSGRFGRFGIMVGGMDMAYGYRSMATAKAAAKRDFIRNRGARVKWTPERTVIKLIPGGEGCTRLVVASLKYEVKK